MSFRRKSTQDVPSLLQASQNKSNPTRRASLRNSLKHSAKTSQHELNLRLGRMPTMEAPTNRKERHQRRSRRKTDFQRQQSDRHDRLSNVSEQWSNHRKNFVDEDDEFSSSSDGSRRPQWASCCGLDLCCAW